MMMPGRKFSAQSGYRYGFNGKENDNEVKGEGNQQDYGMRIYDIRLGKFLSVDPLTQSYPWYTPYQFAGNNPIKFIDLDGKEPTSTIQELESIRLVHGIEKGNIVSGNFDPNDSKHIMPVEKKFDPAQQKAYFISEINGNHVYWKTTENTLRIHRKADGSVIANGSWESYVPKIMMGQGELIKNIFWDAGPGALNPIKDFEIYGSIQGKGTIGGKEGKSEFKGVTAFGGQLSLSTDKGGQADLITPKDSYINIGKTDLWDIRSYPYKYIGSESKNFGDLPAGYRGLITIPQWSIKSGNASYKTQIDLSLGGGDLKAGLRGVGEIKFGDYGSVEVNAGARVTLKWPAVIQAMLNSSEIK